MAGFCRSNGGKAWRFDTAGSLGRAESSEESDEMAGEIAVERIEISSSLDTY